jgi:hypothetical protein
MENINTGEIFGGKRLQPGLSDKACQVADWFGNQETK